MNHSKIKGLTLCSLVALFAAGQAVAHTGVRDKVTVSATAGASSYNGFTITHGCGGDSGNAYPVLGQSAVFPTGDRVVWREGAAVAGAPDSNIIGIGGGAGIFDTIVLDHAGVPLPDGGLNLQVTGYAGISSPFATTQEIVDPNALNPGVVEGLLWKDGAMEPKLNAITPFKVTVPKIIDPTVKQVNVRIGVINYCDFGKNAANDARAHTNSLKMHLAVTFHFWLPRLHLTKSMSIMRRFSSLWEQATATTTARIGGLPRLMAAVRYITIQKCCNPATGRL